jgi:hypothetical protein
LKTIHCSMRGQNMLSFASSNFWWSQAIVTVMSRCAITVDVLGTHVLIMHRNNIPVVSTCISFLILVRVLKCSHIILLLAWSIIYVTVSSSSLLRSIDTRQFLWRLLLIWAVHAQTLIHIVHILRSSKVLKNILNILVISGSVWSSSS